MQVDCDKCMRTYTRRAEGVLKRIKRDRRWVCQSCSNRTLKRQVPKVVVLMYHDKLMSLADISREVGVPISTVRARVLASGLGLRSRADGIRLASPKLSAAGRRRIYAPHSIASRRKQSRSALKRADLYAKGISLKPSGYYEITRGADKGRTAQRVIAGGLLGRKLKKWEIVHHINGIRTDNTSNNLMVMSRSEHSRFHQLTLKQPRSRNTNGTFT